MKNITIKQYKPDYYSLWNEFVAKAKNATFLFHRDFMEYHQDRFEDFSLLIFEDEKLVSILPANRVGDCVFSHQGLTYGGFVFDKKTKVNQVFEYLDATLLFLKMNQVKKFILKPIPIFYSKTMSSEIDFYLFQLKADLFKKDLNLSVILNEYLVISKSKLKKYRKTLSLDIIIKQNEDFSMFWNDVLTPRLIKKYDVKPVHTLAEIQNLAKYFPNNIKQFDAYFEGKIVAGITVFESENVVKSQYGATTDKGEEIRALDFLFINLIKKYSSEGKKFFDMGIVTDTNFKNGFNIGLLQQKEELGSVVFEQNHYLITL